MRVGGVDIERAEDAPGLWVGPAVGTCGVFQPAMWISTGYNFQEQPVDISVKTLIEGPGLYHLGESETLSFGFQRVTIYWNNQLIFRSKPLTRLSNG